MSFQDLKNLAQNIQDIIFSDSFSIKHKLIFDEFYLNQNQANFILDLEEKIWLKKIDVLNLPQELKQMERAEYYDLRALALELALKIFWPLQDYLKNVDRLILRLGGKVPALSHLPSAESEGPGSPDHFLGSIKSFLAQYPHLNSAYLSPHKIINQLGQKVSPTVENWLKNYFHFLGAAHHDSLQRAQFLAKEPNILALDNLAKENLRYFFTSYDEDLVLDISLEDNFLYFKVQDKLEQKIEQAISVEDLLKILQTKLNELQATFVDEKLLSAEAGTSLYKLRDILWQALSLQDIEKTLGILKVLVQRKALDLLLDEDKRFVGLLKRFVSIKFGDLAMWPSQDKLIRLRLFMELILADKLRLDNQRATLLAYYFANLYAKNSQIVYLDLATKMFKWRELELNNKQLVWIK